MGNKSKRASKKAPPKSPAPTSSKPWWMRPIFWLSTLLVTAIGLTLTGWVRHTRGRRAGKTNGGTAASAVPCSTTVARFRGRRRLHPAPKVGNIRRRALIPSFLTTCKWSSAVAAEAPSRRGGWALSEAVSGVTMIHSQGPRQNTCPPRGDFAKLVVPSTA